MTYKVVLVVLYRKKKTSSTTIVKYKLDQMATKGTRKNYRGHEEQFIKKEHAIIQRIKTMLRLNKDLDNLGPIPPYPQPVEFHVTRASHFTYQTGMEGIVNSGGFLPGRDKLLWWSIEVDDDDITAAEKRFLQSLFPNRTEAQAEKQKPFLQQFTTSPAFLKSSRYGNFKFTFDLKELLHEYRKQMCNGEKPILRVYETMLYKQEIIHSVIIHSPDTHEFDEYPIFPTGLHDFLDGTIVWCPEAMSGTHRYELITDVEENTVHARDVGCNPTQYVWNNLTLAFHIKSLKFDKATLVSKLSACKIKDPELAEIATQKVAQFKERYGAQDNIPVVN
ncbi:uncharacterized protein LOC118770061 [Megalops cyprinoides]|uniref:uncharacterized protein LOC118770061 n=1 Tax=Megalops cyprinoides TaxID=118141 RepID=UPI001864127E|nr:uncharacterized protein LOC118770061 [Megalops cyprinoides]